MARASLLRPGPAVTEQLEPARRPGPGGWRRPGRPRRSGPRNPWLLVPVLLAALGAGAISALNPLIALGLCAALALAACVWRWPALAAYLLIGLTPFITGINRGHAGTGLRPNEALAVLAGGTLAVRGITRLRSGQVPRFRLSLVELSIVLMAVTNSIVPMLWMLARQRQITLDDVLYALVLWKYLGLYYIIRASVTTDRQVARCLVLSVAAASIVAVIAILQALELFGVPKLLTTYYAPFGNAAALQHARGGATLGLPAATADLLIFNLAIVSGLWTRWRRHRGALAIAAALCVLGALSAGEFSSAIGLTIGVVCIAVVMNSPKLLYLFLPAGLIGSEVLRPVISRRLSGFQSVSGLPTSWAGRLQNLRGYFWPKLFSDWNFLLGVRPSARVAVASQATGYVWIESGYTWLLWGGGIPLFASFVFFVYAAVRTGWKTAHRSRDAASVAGVAVFVAVIVTAVLMIFDPHVTYRGSADLLFALLALAGSQRKHRDGEPRVGNDATGLAMEVRT